MTTTRSVTSRRVLILGVGTSLTNFRGPLIRAMLAAGHRVSAVGDEYHAGMAQTLAGWGVDYRVIPLARAGMNPLVDAASLAGLVRLMREVRPDVFFGYTIKPSTIGLLAARIAGVECRVAMITGLGYAWTVGGGLRRRLARFAVAAACRLAFRFADRVVFQNPDDEALFVSLGLVEAGKAARVAGSGVDLVHYAVAPQAEGPTTFLLVARLLRDKGIGEYVKAARRVRELHPGGVRFLLVGPLDPHPASVTRAEVEAWVREGVIEWPGEVSDVRPHVGRSHVFVLPSFYREGVPRSILEAMSMGRAVITTDAPGCRETVMPGVNGFLVASRDAGHLAEAILRFVAEPGLASRMGAESRRIAQERFDVNLVNERMLELIGLSALRREVPAVVRRSESMSKVAIVRSGNA